MTVIETIQTKEMQIDGTNGIIVTDGSATYYLKEVTSILNIAQNTGGASPLLIGYQGTSIGTSGVTSKIIFFVGSTTKASIPCPAMTTAQKNAISPSVEGSMVYDLTLHKVCVWTGAAWETITSV